MLALRPKTRGIEETMLGRIPMFSWATANIVDSRATGWTYRFLNENCIAARTKLITSIGSGPLGLPEILTSVYQGSIVVTQIVT